MEPGKGYFVWPGDNVGTLVPPYPENKAPVLVIDVSPLSANVSEEITVNTSGTYDEPSSVLLRIDCDWGDGTVETQWFQPSYAPAPIFAHSYTKGGIYTITVVATDIYGAVDMQEATVTIYPLSSNTIYVPDDYEKIQWAVDNASAGDTIIVRDGTYTENVDVNIDNLTIQSENGSENCIVQAANSNDYVFDVMADYVNICGLTIEGATELENAGFYLHANKGCYIINNTVSNNYYGIWLLYSSNNTLTNNTAHSNIRAGIHLLYSSSNMLANNTAWNNKWWGIRLWNSDENILTSNIMRGNWYNFDIESRDQKHSEYIQNIDTSNLVDGKPIYYWVNQRDKQIPSDAGFVGIVDCINISTKNVTLMNNFQGVLLSFSRNCLIENRLVAN
ncbi:MAG TPA: NosD domain-containing protein [Desulfobacteria bacterium]|nr:NosD domain-containing protein [Desulfobacteria bacterium]